MGRHFSVRRGAAKIVFGAGSSGEVLKEVAELGATKVLVVCAPGRAKDAAALGDRLGSRFAAVHAGAREHVPLETVKEARRALDASGADAVLALGGGSAIGLAKALALQASVRVIAIPTTYSGSEMTSMYGITDAGEKRTGKDERVRPQLVVYDPDRTAGLPRDVAMTSLWNALAHATEALWVNDDDRGAHVIAEDAVRLLSSSMQRLAVRLDDAEAREDALEGAYLAATAFSDAGAGLHHKLCHVLGGMFGLPHAATHAVLLPHVVRFNREASPGAMSALARAMGVVDPVAEMGRLAAVTGVPTSLAKVGMPRDGISRVVDAILALPRVQPRAVDRDTLTAMLEQASAEPPKAGPAARLRGPQSIATQPGLGGTHDSEALAGALPRTQNAPRLCPYGLIPELVNGTPFTVRSAENSRVWLYRVRASFSHGELTQLPSAAFLSPLAAVTPNRMRWRPMPMPAAPSRVDFLDGMATLGGAGDPTSGAGFLVHMYAANADMSDRAFSSADGDLLLVPQTGTLECRTELGWLRVAPGSIAIIPRGIRFAIGFSVGDGGDRGGDGGGDAGGRGWMLEVFGRRLRLPERGLIGSNGLADARHFLAPTASFEDRECPAGFQIVTKTGGALYAATQSHSPFDVVAWHGTHVPSSYDMSLFSPLGSVRIDHPDPSILTVLTAPLDDHGRAICDFVLFPGRWDVLEHSFRPPFMHRNAASEVNCVVRTPSPEHGYDPGCTFLSPLLTPHGVSTATYDAVFGLSEQAAEGPRRLSDDSVWVMFESALPFRLSAWAKSSPLLDRGFGKLFEGMRSRFDPSKP
jgi:homogentisate 1,2-dioxygenase